MHRNASSSAVLPGLLLAVLVAALSLFVAPSATAGPSTTQLLGSTAATSALALHDEATVHRGGTGVAHPLPVQQLPATVLADARRAASPQSIGTRTGSGPAAEPGVETTSTVQGRAPPATAR